MNNYIDALKKPSIIITIILIAIVVGLISYLDDKANKHNKKSFLGHCKLVMICLLSALIMLFGYIFIENSSEIVSNNISNINTNQMVFNDDIMRGDPGF